MSYRALSPPSSEEETSEEVWLQKRLNRQVARFTLEEIKTFIYQLDDIKPPLDANEARKKLISLLENANPVSPPREEDARMVQYYVFMQLRMRDMLREINKNSL